MYSPDVGVGTMIRGAFLTVAALYHFWTESLVGACATADTAFILNLILSIEEKWMLWRQDVCGAVQTGTRDSVLGTVSATSIDSASALANEARSSLVWAADRKIGSSSDGGIRNPWSSI